MPLTENGFERLTYDDILSLQIERAQLLFGDDIDTSEQSVFGKILRLYCLDAAENQELAEGVYLGAFPHTASGVSLDRLCPLAGISRNPATYAQHEIEITGTVGAVIPMGFLVSAGDVVFHTVDAYTIGDDGKVSAIVECNDAGEIGNVAVGDIVSIVNPDANVTSIAHTSISAIANEVETDFELRARFQQALSGTGSGTLDAIRGAILRVSGVESVLIEENDTDSVITDLPVIGDLPPHSFRCFVLAPASANKEIAEAIFSKKPIGIKSVGTVYVPVYDSGGGEHLIGFSHTLEQAVFVRCTIVVNSNYSADSLQAIKDNIVQKLSAYTNGQAVTATSLYGAVYVDGVADVTSLTISADGETYSTDAIAIARNQVARATDANIEVTVSE